MSEKQQQCADCGNRREFMGMLGGAAAVLTGATLPTVGSAAPKAKKARPAEAMIRELYQGMNDWQREHLVYPWNHGSRQRTFNSSLGEPIGMAYTRAQRELIELILKSMSSGEAGYEKISRGGSWDTRNGIQDCGAHIFGDPGKKDRYSFVFSGHHMTIRCDGNTEDNMAFGGPVYHGHSPNGYSPRNVFNYQTRSAMAVFEALTAKQRATATVQGRAGQGDRSVRLRGVERGIPGIDCGELNAAQKKLVEQVMVDMLSPYRKEDVDEIMKIVRQTGGLDAMHLAFYESRSGGASQPWSYWRLEGPGLVWNFRALPHVHLYVNIGNIQPQKGTN